MWPFKWPSMHGLQIACEKSWRAVVATQLAERSLPIPEVRGSNPVKKFKTLTPALFLLVSTDDWLLIGAWPTRSTSYQIMTLHDLLHSLKYIQTQSKLAWPSISPFQSILMDIYWWGNSRCQFKVMMKL